MDSMRTAVLCACLTALGLTLAEHILPTERFERQIRLIFTALMTIAVLKPLTNLDFSPLYSDTAPDLSVSGEMPADKVSLIQNKLTELIIKKVCTIVVDDLWLWIRYMSVIVARSRQCRIKSGSDVQGTKWIFRGQANADWPICSSFELRVANKYMGATAYRDRELRTKEKYSI